MSVALASDSLVNLLLDGQQLLAQRGRSMLQNTVTALALDL
jgi:hypothetical protein